ncbi:CNP1-like family protein [Rhodoferax lacus]|nr:CNP1-like family protein [Rhodoferax lacus]
MSNNNLARLTLACMLALSGTCSLAQSGNGTDNPDWAEEATPPPPAFSKDRLIPIDMPSYVSIKVGVDPETIAVGSDGVVRYVIVMANATGSTNAVYEGIRCVTDEVKTYARLNASGAWVTQAKTDWKPVNDNMPSRHAQAFARQGGCQSRLATSKQEIIDALRSGQKPGLGKRSN